MEPCCRVPTRGSCGCIPVRFQLSRGTEIEKKPGWDADLLSSLPKVPFPFVSHTLFMSNTFALLQYDGDPLNHRLIDHEGRLAFTM
jgi:hypothetical protein